MVLPLIATTASILSSALGSVKSARELAKNVSDHELKDQIGAAYETLLDLREHVLTLDEENRTLKAQLAERAKYVGPLPPNGYYYAESDTQQRHPICPRCFQGANHLTAYMGSIDHDFQSGRRLCNVCNLAIYEQSSASNGW